MRDFITVLAMLFILFGMPFVNAALYKWGSNE